MNSDLKFIGLSAIGGVVAFMALRWWMNRGQWHVAAITNQPAAKVKTSSPNPVFG